MISRIFIVLVLTLGLSACARSANDMRQIDFEFLPSNTDQVSKLLSSKLKSRLSSSGSHVFNPNSEEFNFAAGLVERQIHGDLQELLDYQIDPSNHRVFCLLQVVKPLCLQALTLLSQIS